MKGLIRECINSSEIFWFCLTMSSFIELKSLKFIFEFKSLITLALDIIVSGPIPPNPSELLNGTNMDNLLLKLKKKYDYVILDTPPIGIVTDGVILMNKSDINLYIVRHNYTKRNMLNIVNDLYTTNQIKNTHIIINDYQISSSGYGYGYGYGYVYGKGYGYYEE